jgi:hypothetical protein
LENEANLKPHDVDLQHALLREWNKNSQFHRVIDRFENGNCPPNDPLFQEYVAAMVATGRSKQIRLPSSYSFNNRKPQSSAQSQQSESVSAENSELPLGHPKNPIFFKVNGPLNVSSNTTSQSIQGRIISMLIFGATLYLLWNFVPNLPKGLIFLVFHFKRGSKSFRSIFRN